MATLRITLFGKFQAWWGTRILQGCDAAKVQELLCYVLLNHAAPLSREMLASLLWEHCSTAQSKAYLRKVLWQLQLALERPAEESGQPVLLVDPDWIQVNVDADLWVDVITFEEAFRDISDVPGMQLTRERAQVLEDAVHLYKSDLLENCYQDWCLSERERFLQMYLLMLDKLVDYCEAHFEYDAAVAYCLRILQLDSAREHTHRRLMFLRYLSGDRTGALRQYERCVSALKKELDVKPSRRTHLLYEQIRADEMEESRRETGQVVLPGREEAASAVDRLERIRSLQQVLIAVQSQIQREIEAVELALQRRV